MSRKRKAAVPVRSVPAKKRSRPNLYADLIDEEISFHLDIERWFVDISMHVWDS